MLQIIRPLLTFVLLCAFLTPGFSQDMLVESGKYECCQGTKSVLLQPDSHFVLTNKNLAPDNGFISSTEKFGRFEIESNKVVLFIRAELHRTKMTTGDTVFYQSPKKEELEIVKPSDGKGSVGLKKRFAGSYVTLIRRR